VRSHPSTPVATFYGHKLATATPATYPEIAKAMTIDGWVQGANAAKAGLAGSDDMDDDTVDMGAPVNARPGWALTADTSAIALPVALTALISGAMHADPPSPSDADASADTATAYASEAGSQNAYQAGGVTSYNVENDDDACQMCQDVADGGPYDVGDDPVCPVHSGCGCHSIPIVPTDTDGTTP
jgi:hypothetical protein